MITKTFTITVVQDGQKEMLNTKIDGFTTFELIGVLEYVRDQVQIGAMVKTKREQPK